MTYHLRIMSFFFLVHIIYKNKNVGMQFSTLLVYSFSQSPSDPPHPSSPSATAVAARAENLSPVGMTAAAAAAAAFSLATSSAALSNKLFFFSITGTMSVKKSVPGVFEDLMSSWDEIRQLFIRITSGLSN